MPFTLAAAAAGPVGLSMVVSDAEAAKRSSAVARRTRGMQTPWPPPKSPGQHHHARPDPQQPMPPPLRSQPLRRQATAKRSPKRNPLMDGAARTLSPQVQPSAALASHAGFGDELASMLDDRLAGRRECAGWSSASASCKRSTPAAMQSSAGTGFAGAGSMPYATAGAQPVQSPCAAMVPCPANSAALHGHTCRNAVRYCGQFCSAASSARAWAPALPGIGAGVASSAAPVRNIPADFDVAGFVRNAKCSSSACKRPTMQATWMTSASSPRPKCCRVEDGHHRARPSLQPPEVVSIEPIKCWMWPRRPRSMW